MKIETQGIKTGRIQQKQHKEKFVAMNTQIKKKRMISNTPSHSASQGLSKGKSSSKLVEEKNDEDKSRKKGGLNRQCKI